MSFIDDWEAMLGMTGVENADLAWYFARIPFESAQDRDGFIQELTRAR